MLIFKEKTAIIKIYYLKELVMNILIIYDSYYGNTKQVALSFKNELEDKYFINVMHAKDIVKANIEQFNIIIFGCPTRAFNMTKPIKKIIKNKDFDFTDKKVFVYDTRIEIKKGEKSFLSKLMKSFGYASEKMEKELIKRKANIIMPYKYYYVLDTEGPLEISVADKVKADTDELKEKIMELG